MFFFIYVVLIFWFVVLFLDTIFKTCMFSPYLKFLELSGLRVLPLYISLHVTRYNRIICQMGKWRPLLLKKWYNLGVLTTAIIIVPSTLICIFSIYQMLTFSESEQYDSSLLVPVVPGYNMPSSHILYYFLIFSFCSAFHEFGHALAASREGVNLIDCGFAVFGAFSYAFVNFLADNISNLSRKTQLRIFCAGIWHNVLLTLIAIMLHWLLYIIFWPLFSTGSGVTVIGIKQESVFNQPGGFEVGDILYKVGNCTFQDRLSFRHCLRNIAESPPQGFCIPDDPRFEEIYKVDNKKCVDFPDYHSFSTKGNMHKKDICLKARDVAAYGPCSEISHCEEGLTCLYPVLAKYDHFIIIQRYGKKPVLFEGAMDNILSEVDISSYIPRLNILSASIPETVALLLEYIIMFSSGFALLNVVPSYYLDGAFITECFLHMALEGHICHSKICAIVILMKRLGSGILFGLFVAAFKVFLFSGISEFWWNR